ncbi:MAG: thiamine pyrophosphate-binding protein [Acidimicrobiales bacterium]
MVLGSDVLLEVLRSEGVTHLFGNPGSTELPLIDALADADDLHYILGLQEATVVGMADGYAQATGRAAFVNLHTSAGLGNAIGNLTNAKAMGTPLVVTAGQQDYRHIATDPLLSGPLVEIAGGSVKWGHEVRTAEEIGTILRRAFRGATAPPSGPVFTALPMNLLDETVTTPVPAASTIDHVNVAGNLEELADLLCGPATGRVALVVGDAVATSGAVSSAVALAEALGAPVYGSPLHGRGVFPPTHPLWHGMLNPAAIAIHEVLRSYDRVFVVGDQAFLVYPYTPGPAVPPEVELLHLSADPAQLARTWPLRLGVVGHPRATLAALLPLVLARADSDAARAAVVAGRTRRSREIDEVEATALDRYESVPMHPMAAAHALVRSLPADSIVVDEAITTGVYVRGFHHWTEPGRYFFCPGGGLGWGMPAACGVSLAHDRAPVLCVVGDGSAMYSPQALWTAAAEQLPVVFAVVNNRQYKILDSYLLGRQGPSARTGRHIGMSLAEPPIDYVALATSMGVAATYVEHAADVGDAVTRALASGRPHVLELPIST